MRLQARIQKLNQIHPSDESERWYDILEDWDLIETSFVKQYGIRLRTEQEMSWPEFLTLLGGLMEDTPLGRIVAIRSEQDIDVLNNFTSEQKKIRNRWMSRHGNGTLAIAKMQDTFKAMFS